MLRLLLIAYKLLLFVSSLAPIFAETTVVSPKAGNRIMLAKNPAATADFDTHLLHPGISREVSTLDTHSREAAAFVLSKGLALVWSLG